MNKTCIIIAGPTAVGKTSVAIELAQQFFTEIISADSRQCYKELTIGVAKPSLEELATVHHYFINSHCISENVSAADFENYSLDSAEKIFEENDVAVMTGGTGLYIKAFAEGLDEIPAIDETVKKNISENYDVAGIAWLQEQIKKQDPGYFSNGEMQNPRRMMRALEVKMSTGKSIRDFQSQLKKLRPFHIIKIGLELPRELLYQRINERVDKMMDAGLLEEARALLPYRNLNALQTVGYRELFDYFDGLISLNRAVELIKQNSRHYAKRQMTWFKKDKEMIWVDMQDPVAAVNSILKYAENGIGE
jgi:tRNA dimethylallyltransferase